VASQVTPTRLAEVRITETHALSDAHGVFFESFHLREFSALVASGYEFVKDNQSRSVRNVLRGLHYQIEHAQGKLVRVIVGEVFDVAVDMRKSSPNFSKWMGLRLSAGNKHQFCAPRGFVHGSVMLSSVAEFLCKTTDYRLSQHECSIRWSDTDVNIDWQLTDEPIAEKDAEAPLFAAAERYP